MVRKLLFLTALIGMVVAGQSQNICDYPEYPVPAKYRLKAGAGLPSKVDNSAKAYFPAVFNQYGWSCNQASSIGYVFTYEINRLRKQKSEEPENLYTPGFAWNFLNSSNSGVGVSYFDSWEIVKAAGCPNYADYPYYQLTTGVWMSGYDKYYRAMQNRILQNYSLPVGTPEELALFKQYLVDHFEDSPDGGIASIQIASDGMLTGQWKDPETEERWPVLYTFGSNIGHALTFVGFNDSVRFDVNYDGKCTNDIDINDDGVVDMKDWEIGALLTVNSWGDGFWNGGKVYVLYSVVAREGNEGGIWNRSVHVVKATKYYNPELTMRVVMRHEERKRFRVLAGFSTDTTATEPQQTLSFPIFNYQGDKTPLEDPENTNDSRRFEFGLDITPFVSLLDPDVPVKFFLMIQEDDPYGTAEGRVDEFSVIHYANGADETISKQKNVEMVNNGLTVVSVTKSLDFDKLKVEEPFMTNISNGKPFYGQLSASGGKLPYRWELVRDYQETQKSIQYEPVTGITLANNENKISSKRVALPFEFPFYGSKYNFVVVDIRGALHFNNEYFQYPYAINADLGFRIRKSIVPFWADMNFNNPGEALVYQATDSVVTFEWKASVYVKPLFYPVMVNASLYSDGRIEFRYGERSIPQNSDYEWQAGISNGDAALYKYASVSGTHQSIENQAITYTPFDYPDNISLTEEGTLSGLANAEDHIWNILVKVTDSYNQVEYASLPVSTVITDTATVVSKSFPNPFYRTTSITFTVDQESPVILEIFDFSGRKIKELVSQTLLPNVYTYYWNSRDARNRDVKPGTYIYRLRIGANHDEGKLILIK